MKKKFIALGMTFLAGLALASCGDNTKTTTGETTTVETTTATGETTTETTTETGTGETTTETTTESTTEQVTYTFYEGTPATYVSKGFKAFYYGSDGKVYDEDMNEVSAADLYIDYLEFEVSVAEVKEDGSVKLNVTPEEFRAAYKYEYMLDLTNGEDVKEVGYVKWAEELKDGDVAIVALDEVLIVGNGVNAAETLGLAKDDELKLKTIEDELFESKLEAMNYIYEEGPVDVSGKELATTYELGTEDTYLAYGQAVLDAIEAEELEPQEVIDLYNAFCDKYYYIVDEYKAAKILSDKDNTPESYDLADELEALMDDFGAMDEEIDLAAYNSNKYMEFYYSQNDRFLDEEGNLDLDAVKAYADGLNPSATTQLNEISQTMNGALSSYYKGEKSAAEALTTYFTAAKEYADFVNYDNYLEYAYAENFGREYTVEDTDALADYIAEYIVPVNQYAASVFMDFDAASEADAKTTRVYANAWNEFIGLYRDYYGNYFEYFADYAENEIGDEMAENFKYYFTSGNYWYSATENDNVTGYVWSFSDGTPLMFLGPDCQDISTFIHEFGHYNEHITAKDSAFYSMDLNEVHSQGNEMLFYLYLTTTDAASEIATAEFLNYKIYSMSNTVIEGFLINELEKWAYTQDMTKYAVDGGALQFEKDLRKAWSDVCIARNLKDYDDDDTFTKWVELVLLNYQGYYISYSTSAVAALQVYAKAVENWDDGVAAYKKLYAPHEATDTFSSVLVDSGYYSIFDEAGYALIAEACGVDLEAGAEA